MLFMLEADTTSAIETWTPVIVQGLITIGAIFGGAGFWTWKQNKDQAKRDAKEKENGVVGKVDKLSGQVTGIADQVTSLSYKVGDVSEDLQEIKQDVFLLQEANEETVKYRELRDANDKRALVAQQAVIESLKGLLRERLMDNYNRCMEKGYYSKEERETYGELFRCYESDPFDGNGVMHDIRPIIRALPWTAEEAKRAKKG